jgi:hypothetical protein
MPEKVLGKVRKIRISVNGMDSPWADLAESAMVCGKIQAMGDKNSVIRMKASYRVFGKNTKKVWTYVSGRGRGCL